MQITDEMVEVGARAASVRYPEGDGSAPGQAWYWSERHNHPANEFAHEARDEDREIARSVLTAVAEKRECQVCGGDTGRYDFDPQACACSRPTSNFRRYAMVFDGEEGWTMLPDPDGEYVKFEDVATLTTKGNQP